jgi:hypothetical protein
MNRLSLSLALVLGAVSTALAQLSVEVRLEQEQFLAGESIIAAVRITNRSGQTLHLGEDEDWLTFTVDSTDRRLMPRLDDPLVVGGFDLETSKVATKRVNLSPCFPLAQPGRYSVTATVKVKEWGAERSSRPKSFNVLSGSSLWEQEFGVPRKPGDTNALPEIRHYSLHQANFLKGQLRLYFRLTDPTGAHVLKVVPIGIMLSFSRPEAQVDQESKLHVLYLNGPHSYSYTVFDPDGTLLLRQTYDFTDARPALKLSTDSRIYVSGGVRRVTAADLPPPSKEELEPEPAPGADTNSVSAIEETTPAKKK